MHAQIEAFHQKGLIMTNDTGFAVQLHCLCLKNRENEKEDTMGQFDFVKETGRKRFNRDENAAEKAKKLIEEQNPGIESLQLEFNNGVVSISGKATSADAMKKKGLRSAGVLHPRD
jgi:hypothetical protein